MLREADADAFVGLRREALLDSPLSFTSSPEDARSIDAEGFRAQVRGAPQSVVLGAFADADEGDLVAMVGIHRDPHAKVAHKAHVWGMYVTPAWRGRGLGRQLLDAAIEHARTLDGVAWIMLGVAREAPAARSLYESAGFVAWGEEADAVRHQGAVTSVVHMALHLTPPRVGDWTSRPEKG
jgi:GNAT superfamily N-acetyltransferase